MEIPISDVAYDVQYTIVELVTKILEEKKQNPLADTSLLEREIDKKVYELYGLTEEEIRVVEGM